MSLKEQFGILTNYFETEKMDFALVGALALHAYGYTRATRDIDFITRETYQEKIIGFMESLSFQTLHRSAGFSNHFNPTGKMRVDLIYVDDPTGNTIFKARNSKAMFGNKDCPVVNQNHLVLLKLFVIKNDPERKFKELAAIKALKNLVQLDKAMIVDFLEKNNLMELHNDIFS